MDTDTPWTAKRQERGRMRGEINGGKSGMTKKTRSTFSPWRSRGKKGGTVLNRFIGLQATTIIFVSHSGPIVSGREAVEWASASLSFATQQTYTLTRPAAPSSAWLIVRANYRRQRLLFRSDSNRGKRKKIKKKRFRAFASFHENVNRRNRPGWFQVDVRSILSRCSHENPRHEPPPGSGVNLPWASMDADSKEIFIVNDTTADFSESSDTELAAQKLFIGNERRLNRDSLLNFESTYWTEAFNAGDVRAAWNRDIVLKFSERWY